MIPFKEIAIQSAPVGDDFVYRSVNIRVQHKDIPRLAPGMQLPGLCPVMLYEEGHELWDVNEVQFAQLISGMKSCGVLTEHIISEVADATGLSPADVGSIVQCAEVRFKDAEKELPSETTEPTED
jgi:hypothetical protein